MVPVRFVIDSVRSVEVTSTDTGSIVLAVEDPHTVAVVEMPRDDAKLLLADLTRRLADGA